MYDQPLAAYWLVITDFCCTSPLAITQDDADKAVLELSDNGYKAKGIQLDQTDGKSIKGVREYLEKNYDGKLNVLVCNAGVSYKVIKKFRCTRVILLIPLFYILVYRYTTITIGIYYISTAPSLLFIILIPVYRQTDGHQGRCKFCDVI